MARVLNQPTSPVTTSSLAVKPGKCRLAASIRFFAESDLQLPYHAAGAIGMLSCPTQSLPVGQLSMPLAPAACCGSCKAVVSMAAGTHLSLFGEVLCHFVQPGLPAAQDVIRPATAVTQDQSNNPLKQFDPLKQQKLGWV